MKLTLLAVVLCLVLAYVNTISIHVQQDDLNSQWTMFKEKYGRHYETAEEEQMRYF